MQAPLNTGLQTPPPKKNETLVKQALCVFFRLLFTCSLIIAWVFAATGSSSESRQIM